MRKVILGILLWSTAVTLTVHAEAYRWVDEQGNVHFGDRPPDKSRAQDISNQIERQNLDESGATTRKLLEEHDRREAAVKTEQQQISDQTSEHTEKRAKACKEARRQLQILRGRVIFYDNDGQEVKVTEKEREAQATNLTRQIATYCN